MNDKYKKILRNILIFCKLDLTKNLHYDRLTEEIMHKVISEKSNCIDVGAHKGEILETILKLSPQGKHYAFEPIPELYENLQKTFAGRATIYGNALGEKEGVSQFFHVKNAPAYSGLRKRKYAISNPTIEEINVKVSKLDDLIPESTPIDFIKIDVEGGEFNVLKGGEQILKRDKPYIVFEYGLGASDYYEGDPKTLYHFIQNLDLEISTLKNFVKGKASLTEKEFYNYYIKNEEYYFIIHRKE